MYCTVFWSSNSGCATRRCFLQFKEMEFHVFHPHRTVYWQETKKISVQLFVSELCGWTCSRKLFSGDCLVQPANVISHSYYSHATIYNRSRGPLTHAGTKCQTAESTTKCPLLTFKTPLNIISTNVIYPLVWQQMQQWQQLLLWTQSCDDSICASLANQAQTNRCLQWLG